MKVSGLPVVAQARSTTRLRRRLFFGSTTITTSPRRTAWVIRLASATPCRTGVVPTSNSVPPSKFCSGRCSGVARLDAVDVGQADLAHRAGGMPPPTEQALQPRRTVNRDSRPWRFGRAAAMHGLPFEAKAQEHVGRVPARADHSSVLMTWDTATARTAQAQNLSSGLKRVQQSHRAGTASAKGRPASAELVADAGDDNVEVERRLPKAQLAAQARRHGISNWRASGLQAVPPARGEGHRWSRPSTNRGWDHDADSGRYLSRISRQVPSADRPDPARPKNRRRQRRTPTAGWNPRRSNSGQGHEDALATVKTAAAGCHRVERCHRSVAFPDRVPHALRRACNGRRRPVGWSGAGGGVPASFGMLTVRGNWVPGPGDHAVQLA